MSQSAIEKVKKEVYPKLTPILDPWIPAFLKGTSRLTALFGKYGSPLNIHNVEPFVENYKRYVGTLKKHGLKHLILFARKANKSISFVRGAKEAGFGVDTASLKELQQCLNEDVDPQKLVLTAAVKTKAMIKLAVEHQVLIILDNHDEIEAVAEVARDCGSTAKIGVRVSGFEVCGDKLYSRFGFDVEQVVEVIADEILANDYFDYKGFHFHLNGYSIPERSMAILTLIGCVDQLKSYGANTEFIDIGGGLLMNYLSDQQEWEYFQQELQLAVAHRREPITFNNNGLGYKIVDGQLTGKLETYPYFNQTPKEVFLDEILSYKTEQGTIAAMLKDRDMALRLEPGRSLLDQSGITIARVVFRKKDSRDNWLIGLEMNRTQLFSSSADFLLDPVFLPKEEGGIGPGPVSVYFVGAYCLEQDVILKRKIILPHLPGIGDMVCFPNSAGYMMHFYESEAHLFDLSANLVLTGGGEVIEDK